MDWVRLKVFQEKDLKMRRFTHLYPSIDPIIKDSNQTILYSERILRYLP